MILVLILKHQLIIHINGNYKKINVKDQKHYFFNDMVNIKNIDLNLLTLDKKSYKNIDIYYIRYIAMGKSWLCVYA